MNSLFQNLIIFEMANNHMGDIQHAKKIIESYSNFILKYPKFKYAMKFQMRDLDTLIHKNHKENSSNKAVQRFQYTKLSSEQFAYLKNYASELGFYTACTAFDEKSLDKLIEIDFDIVKVASCSNSDFPLLNEVAKYKKPIIISFGGSDLETIDLTINFFKNRKKEFAILHCVGEYPTPNNHLNLDKIDNYKKRYEVPVGFSTHEATSNFQAVGLAIAKGACILEKHIGLETQGYKLNNYSTNLEETDSWLASASDAIDACGDINALPSEQEIKDISQFARGVFLNRNINAGEKITKDDLYYAIPLDTANGQIPVSDLSKYTLLESSIDIKKDDALSVNNVKICNLRNTIFNITKEVNNFVKQANLVIPEDCVLEISSHYGITDFKNNGCAIFSLVNREYCKKYIILLPGQSHPAQFHKIKEETFILISGDLKLTVDNKDYNLSRGSIYVIERGSVHEMTTENGCIIEELSTTHIPDDSYSLDNDINNNKNRKFIVNYWRLYD
jgi:sialic acid synthase SpsE/mannose-6-phosphate isomerase-like protein (cupin superfamily)